MAGLGANELRVYRATVGIQECTVSIASTTHVRRVERWIKLQQVESRLGINLIRPYKDESKLTYLIFYLRIHQLRMYSHVFPAHHGQRLHSNRPVSGGCRRCRCVTS